MLIRVLIFEVSPKGLRIMDEEFEWRRTFQDRDWHGGMGIWRVGYVKDTS